MTKHNPRACGKHLRLSLEIGEKCKQTIWVRIGELHQFTFGFHHQVVVLKPLTVESIPVRLLNSSSTTCIEKMIIMGLLL